MYLNKISSIVLKNKKAFFRKRFISSKRGQIFIFATVALLFYVYISVGSLLTTSKARYDLDYLSNNIKLEFPYAINAAAISNATAKQKGDKLLPVCSFLKKTLKRFDIIFDATIILSLTGHDGSDIVLVNCFEDENVVYDINLESVSMQIAAPPYSTKTYNVTDLPETFSLAFSAGNYNFQETIKNSYNVSYIYYFRLKDSVGSHSYVNRGDV